MSSARTNWFDPCLLRNRRGLNEIVIASSDAAGRGSSFEGAFSDASGGLVYENSGLRASKLGRGSQVPRFEFGDRQAISEMALYILYLFII